MNKSTNLFDLIETFDNVARVAALRGIANSAMAKCIGAIRQDIRERKQLERDADNPQTDLDVRNAQDALLTQNNTEELATVFGFPVSMPPLKQASQLHAVYEIAANDARTLADTKWDYPLDIKAMLKFMIDNAQKLDKVTAQALADAIDTDVETIAKMHEVQNLREREALIEATPEIILTFNGFGDNGYEDAVLDLPPLLQHQLGVKVVEALTKTQETVVTRVMRSRRLTELGSIPLLKNAAAKAKVWVDEFETEHADLIREAIENGRNIRTLDDLPRTPAK